jgi:hypothetical protein
VSTPNTHSDARARVLAAAQERGAGELRQVALNEIADLEHRVYMLEQQLTASRQLVLDIDGGKLEAERLLNLEATRGDGLVELLEGVERVLTAGRQAEVARRALAMIQRERSRLAAVA